MHISILGSGRMARAVVEQCQALNYNFYFKADNDLSSQFSALVKHKKEAVIFHASSGSLLPTAVDWSCQLGVPMIQASKGLIMTATSILVNRRALIIEAPDLSLPIMNTGMKLRDDTDTETICIDTCALGAIMIAENLLSLKDSVLKRRVYELPKIIHLFS